MNQIYFVVSPTSRYTPSEEAKLILNELKRYGTVLTDKTLNLKIPHIPTDKLSEKEEEFLNQATNFVAEISGELDITTELGRCYAGRMLPSLCFCDKSSRSGEEIKRATKTRYGRPINIVYYDSMGELRKTVPRKIANFFEYPGNYKLK